MAITGDYFRLMTAAAVRAAWEKVEQVEPVVNAVTVAISAPIDPR